MSTAKLGKPKTAATRKRMSAAQRGKRISAAQREKIGDALRGRPQTPETIAKRAAAIRRAYRAKRRGSGWPSVAEARAQITRAEANDIKPHTPVRFVADPLADLWRAPVLAYTPIRDDPRYTVPGSARRTGTDGMEVHAESRARRVGRPPRIEPVDIDEEVTV